MSVIDRRVVACILIKDGKFLLQHRGPNADYDPNTWGFFGGHIEPGETPEQAVHREMREELQIDIQPTYFGRYEHDSQWGRVERFVFIAPLTTSLEQLRKQQQEGDDLGLFSLEEARALNIRPHRLELLEEVQKTMPSPKATGRSRQKP
jgi:mutator protein MutT